MIPNEFFEFAPSTPLYLGATFLGGVGWGLNLFSVWWPLHVDLEPGPEQFFSESGCTMRCAREKSAVFQFSGCMIGMGTHTALLQCAIAMVHNCSIIPPPHFQMFFDTVKPNKLFAIYVFGQKSS